MAKTQEELNELKEEVETLNKKLAELTDEELEQVNGGRMLINNDEDIDKLEKGICCQCGSRLKCIGGHVFKKKYICNTCKVIFICYSTVKDRKLRWEKYF